MLFNLGELLVNLLKNFSDNKLSIVVKEMGSEFIVKLRASSTESKGGSGLQLNCLRGLR